MQTGCRDADFARQADKLFSEYERHELIDYLAENPLAGDEIPGTGGVRSCDSGPWAAGKRGGPRVIYFLRGRRSADLCASRLFEVR